MTALVWDQIGEREYETGVDHGVLFIPDDEGVYDTGFAWNGLTTITESPTGAEASPQYADNIKYLNLYSIEQFGGTIEAFTYPDEFAQCDGTATPTAGVAVGQQNRKSFGLCYRTKIGNDLDSDAGYKLHLIYGATAAPSEKAYATVNDSPEAIAFSWDITTIPVAVTGLKPSASITIDSTEVTPANLAALEAILYGASDDPRLPLPDEVISIMEGTTSGTGVAVASGDTHVAITGVTTHYLFTVTHWNGTTYAPVTGGTLVNEAAAEALTLTNDNVYKVDLHPDSGHFVPAGQQSEFIVVPHA